MSLLSTGVTALNAAQLGLATTQHNISNANTAGFSRQSTVQATNVAMMTGAGAIGQGAHVATVVRSYSAVLQSQVDSAQSKSSQLDTYHSMIARIDNLLADSTSGISPVMAGFFQGVQDVAANPGLVSARQSMVSSAQALVTRFQTLENRLAELHEETNTQIRDTVGLVNSYSKQIALFNEKIVALSTAGRHTPNDLLDQRDQMVVELNKLVRVTTVQDSQGALNVFAGMGQQLVVGNQVVALEVRPSARDPERYVIAQQGSGAELPENYLDGGKLGGVLSFRNQALDQATSTLGQMAASLALTVNAQQQLGQDLLGNVWGDTDFVARIFNISDPKAVANTNNTGTGSIASFTFDAPQISSEGNYYTQLASSDYEVRFIAGGNFTVKRLSDDEFITPPGGVAGPSYSFDGLTLNMNPGHAAGDTYLLQPTREGARNIAVNQDIAADVRKIAAASPVRTDAVSTNTGTGRITSGQVTGDSYETPLTYTAAPAPGTLSGFTVGMTVNVDGTDYTITAPTDSVPYPSGGMISFSNGFSFHFNGTPSDGDQFGLPLIQTTLPLTLTYDSGTTSLSGFAAGMTVNVDGTDYTITAPTDSVPYTPGAKISANGFEFNISGIPSDGDQFTLAANVGGIADARNIVRIGALQTASTMNGDASKGVSTFQVSYAQLVSDIGTKTKVAQVDGEAQATVLEQAIAARDAVSGVNLNEEAVNLIKYQQAYQAAAKMMSTASTLFDTLLSIAA
ncbi:MAG: flagellar hook-associated protein FlgK [Azovibrio sp.]|uniref:flagellar hook-associated protein FlgK n=2 Tax=Azovibrio sp. TaxID=1872673 RepID=UPI003C73581A